MGKNKIAAIIISAGYSSRMNRFKPLLKFKNCTAIEKLIQTYKNAGIQDIYVVVGHKSEDIIEVLKGAEVTFVYNESYAEGMFTSVRKGILSLDKNTDAFFMQPVDIPLIKVKTIEHLKSQYIVSNNGILYPTFFEKKGHPPLIDCKYNNIILNSNGEGGLKRILEEFKEDSLDIPVFDEAVLMDMDKIEDYEKLLKYDNLKAPSRKECMAILAHYKVPEHIIKHCEVVESVAQKIYNEISSNGICLDENALMAAARLHDIARKEQNHAIIGRNMIREIGYGFVGDIIASHMDIIVCEDESITEKEILYLADKFVKENQICSVDERFQLSLNHVGENPKAIEKINKRWIAAKVIIKKIEKITGKGFTYE